MGTLTTQKPKSFLKINNKMIIEYHLDSLINAGLKDIIIVVSYLKNMFKSTIGTHYKSLKIEYVDSDLYTSTGHSWSLLLTHKNCHFQCQYYYKPITVRSGVTVIKTCDHCTISL